MDIKLSSKTSTECTEADLTAFCLLVKEGGQVSYPTLEKAVKRAKRLVFLYDGPTLAGTSAIKQPIPAYRERVFRSAGVPANVGPS